MFTHIKLRRVCKCCVKRTGYAKRFSFFKNVCSRISSMFHSISSINNFKRFPTFYFNRLYFNLNTFLKTGNVCEWKTRVQRVKCWKGLKECTRRWRHLSTTMSECLVFAVCPLDSFFVQSITSRRTRIRTSRLSAWPWPANRSITVQQRKVLWCFIKPRFADALFSSNFCSIRWFWQWVIWTNEQLRPGMTYHFMFQFQKNKSSDCGEMCDVEFDDLATAADRTSVALPDRALLAVEDYLKRVHVAIVLKILCPDERQDEWTLLIQTKGQSNKS